MAALALAIMLIGCSPSSDGGRRTVPVAAATTPAAPASPAPDYVGRWTGVEGMVLAVAAAGGPGRYRLTMQYDLDHRQTADATLDGATLVFMRDGRRLTLRPTDGAATGLKYLATKRRCLTVQAGEGYCRD